MELARKQAKGILNVKGCEDKVIFPLISSLIQKAIDEKLIEQRDKLYIQNQLIELFHLKQFPAKETRLIDDTIPNLLEKIIDYAVEEEIIENIFDEKEILSANIMNHFIPLPSEVERSFYEKYEQSPADATNYFYSLSNLSNYIQQNRINKNISFKTKTEYGPLDITINLSKPEKDPEEIKRELEKKQENIDYPRCPLCIENEGYVGRIGYAARANHRMISLPLQDESWYFQYSPYVYYNEHSILLSEKHRNMVINKDTFTRLLLFVDKFPHYFIGSNADLPIVGGSILSHDHYQAGRYHFPMEEADILFSFPLKNFPEVSASTLKWPLSVIRICSEQKEQLIEAADDILQKWIAYNDPTVNIISHTDERRHNTITPIARKREEIYELDLVLRNNRTTEEYPLGIFHPHEDVHHIKKENIGLIEVMGLAVLPARLRDEMEDIKQFLLGETREVPPHHLEWAKQLKIKYNHISDPEEVNDILEKELGKKFVKILEYSGVFKQTEEGIKAFNSFINHVNNH